jgi:hypothetical protein
VIVFASVPLVAARSVPPAATLMEPVTAVEPLSSRVPVELIVVFVALRLPPV